MQGTMFSRGRGKRPVKMFRTCDSMRRKSVITGGVTRLHQRFHCKCTRFTVLCQAGTRDHIFRRTLQGQDVPCGVCKKLSFCRHGRVGSIVTCFQLIIGPGSRRTFGHVVGCPTHNVKSAAIKGVVSTTASGNIDL